MAQELGDPVHAAAALHDGTADSGAQPGRPVAHAVAGGQYDGPGDDGATADVEAEGLDRYLPGVLLDGCLDATDDAALGREGVAVGEQGGGRRDDRSWGDREFIGCKLSEANVILRDWKVFISIFIT